MGYAAGARAAAQYELVENSFKGLALKNMLARQNNNPGYESVREVMAHMDSLLRVGFDYFICNVTLK